MGALQQNISNSVVSYGIDRLSKEDIEEIANVELNKMNPLILSQAYHISPKSFREYLESALGIKVVPTNGEELGSFDIESNSIGINRSIIGTSRELFILAHEFGHYVLHQRLQIGQKSYDSFFDSEINLRTGKHDLTNPRHWIEWQANYFSSCFVLPKIPLYFRLSIVLEGQGRPKGKIYVDDHSHNYNDFNDAIANWLIGLASRRLQ